MRSKFSISRHDTWQVYTLHDWSVKNSIVNLPIKFEGNLKHIWDNLLSPLGAQNKDISTASQMLLTVVRLRLLCRLAQLLLTIKIQ